MQIVPQGKNALVEKIAEAAKDKRIEGLWRNTPAQSLPANMLAIRGGRPNSHLRDIISLRQVPREVITRRSKFELPRPRARHILLGLVIAVTNLDEWSRSSAATTCCSPPAGQAIRFAADDVREFQSRNSTGVEETLGKHFAGQAGLWLAAVDLEAMGDAVRWEPSRGGQLFPHLYARLPLVAVTAYSEVHYEPDGALRLPVAG
eukprot:tig00001467_g8756.t1